jgi:hypothetical protein
MVGNSTKLVTGTEKRKPPAAGKGRPKGSVNKSTKAIKEMILAALDKAGGEEYLVRQSEENPVAFMSLLAKVMPTQITGDDGAAITHEIRIVGVTP